MALTRTRLILIGTVGVLLIAGAAIAFGLRDGGGGAEEAPEYGLLSTAGEEAAAQPGEAAISYSAREDRLEPELYAAGDPQAAEGAAPPDQPATDPKLQGLLDRKIIQSTSVDVQVEEVGRIFQEIIRIAETAGGFVASSTFSNVDDQQVADLTIRVPADQYQGVLAKIRGMGEVATESSDASDVTEEYTDLQARLRTLQATEQRYLELLARAETINDILVVQDRLDAVRAQIEQVQGRINLLEHLTDLATITLHLRPLGAAEPPPVDGGPHPLAAAEAAWERSLEALRGLAAAALVVGVFSWWLLPPLAALGLGARWWLGRRPRPATETTA